MRNNKLSTLVKGFIIGGTMLVPGVSGGTMAMILGIYEDLISAVSNFMKQKRQSFRSVLPRGICWYGTPCKRYTDSFGKLQYACNVLFYRRRSWRYTDDIKILRT